MVAAFAGIVLVDDEADAVDAGAISSVSYTGSGVTVVNETVGASASTIKVDTPSTAGVDDVLYWTTASGEKYYNGQEIAIADISASDVSGGVLTLTAVREASNTEYASVVIDGVSYVMPIADGKFSTSDETYVLAKGIYDGLVGEGYKVTWTAEPTATINNPFTEAVTADTAYTLDADVGTVKWITGDTTLSTITLEDDTEVEIPIAPSRDHYTFAGWATSEGGKVALTYISTTDGYYVEGSTEPTTTVDVADAEVGTVMFYAVYVADTYTVTFVADGQTVGTVKADYNTTIMAPQLPNGYVAWTVDAEGTMSFDFDAPIVADTTVYAVAAVPSDVFTVTFVVDGETIATYASNSVTLPDTPVKEGYQFMGWTINNAVIADPVNYEFTADTQFVAMFQAIDVTTYTVTIQMADGTTQNIEVAEGAVAELPALAEGKVWALGDEIFNPETAIATDIVLKEVDEYYTVSFAVNGTVYDAYAQEVKYGEKASAPAQFVFPDGYSGWDFNFDTVITSDVTVNAALIPAPAEEPAFYETTTGQVAIVIVVFVLLFFGYAVYSNMGGIKDKLFGYTISKKEKKE